MAIRYKSNTQKRSENITIRARSFEQEFNHVLVTHNKNDQIEEDVNSDSVIEKIGRECGTLKIMKKYLLMNDADFEIN